MLMLLLASLAHVHPQALDQTAGNVIPIVLTLENQGIAAEVTVTLPLASGASVLDAGSGAVLPGTDTLTWSLALAEGERRTLGFHLRLPASADTLALNASINAVTAGGAAFSTQAMLSVAVLPAQDGASLLQTLDGLLQGNLEAEARQRLEQARHHLEQAQAALPNDPAKALKEALHAVDRLRHLEGNADIALLRVMIDLWIEWLGQQL